MGRFAVEKPWFCSESSLMREKHGNIRIINNPFSWEWQPYHGDDWGMVYDIVLHILKDIAQLCGLRENEMICSRCFSSRNPNNIK